MPTRADPLARPEVRPDRVAYATGVLLHADDFTAEQTYHRGRLARALEYLHGSGTLAGLRVQVGMPEDGAEERLTVAPGVALDRLGRLVEVPRTACLRLGRWLESLPRDDRAAAFHASGTGPLPPADQPPSAGYLLADLFIRFEACERGFTPSVAAGPFDALDAVAPSRIRDGYRLSLRLREEDDPRLPRSPWPEIPPDATPEQGRRLLQDALLDAAWREGTEWTERGRLDPLPEHATGQDTSDVFLARLVIPVRQATDPVRDPAHRVGVDNHARAFVYPSGALARWLEAVAGTE